MFYREKTFIFINYVINFEILIQILQKHEGKSLNSKILMSH